MEDVPMKPKSWIARLPFYYGYVLMLGSLICIVLSTPGQTIGVSVFVDDIIAAMHTSRNVVSTLYTFATVCAGVFYPWIGPIIDKLGARYGCMLSAFLLGCGCILLSMSRTLALTFMAFVMLRMFGQGSLSMSANYAINQWFIKKRGRCVGLVQTCNSFLMFAVFPVVATWASGKYGWRDVYAFCGYIGEWCICIPSAWLILREKPELFGLHPDGEKLDASSPLISSPVPQVVWTRGMALRTLIFWSMGLSIGLVALIVTGYLFHMTDLVRTLGMPGIGPSVLMLFGIFTGSFTFIGGLIADKLNPVALMSMVLINTSLVCLAQPFLKTELQAQVWGAFLGVSMGGLTQVLSIAWATLFGRPNLGAITAPASSIIMIGTAIGPLPFSFYKSVYGDYDGASVVTAAFPVILLILLNYAWKHHNPNPVVAK